MYEGMRLKNFADVTEITAAQLVLRKADADKAADALVVVDCRDDAEMQVSVIPGAISKAAFDAMLVEEGKVEGAEAPAREVVAYCTIGYRSGLYAKELNERGVTGVANLKGSLLAWTHEGGELLNPEGEATKKVHTWSKGWALAASAYDAEWYAEKPKDGDKEEQAEEQAEEQVRGIT